MVCADSATTSIRFIQYNNTVIDIGANWIYYFSYCNSNPPSTSSRTKSYSFLSVTARYNLGPHQFVVSFGIDPNNPTAAPQFRYSNNWIAVPIEISNAIQYFIQNIFNTRKPIIQY